MQLGDKKLISQEINSVSNRKSPCVIRTQDVQITCSNRKAVRIAITSPNRLPFFFKQADTLPNRVWSKLQFAVDKIIFKIHVKRNVVSIRGQPFCDDVTCPEIFCL